jgi:hypothetical protein
MPATPPLLNDGNNHNHKTTVIKNQTMNSLQQMPSQQQQHENEGLSASPTSVACMLQERALLPEKQQQLDILFFHPVHHVSQTVAQHLHESHRDWMTRTGLSLRFKQNGTIVFEFPCQKGHHAGRIWTSYDAVTKQHYLSVFRRNVIGRFQLAPNNKELIQQVVDQMVQSLVHLDEETTNNKKSAY